MRYSAGICCLAVVFTVAAGCARAVGEPAPAGSPVTSMDAPPRLVGVWEGVEEGREMANAAGPSSSKVELIIAPNGTWSSVTQAGRAEGALASAGRGRITLDGRLASGAPVRYRLWERGDRFLVGAARDDYGGHSADTTIVLHKVR